MLVNIDQLTLKCYLSIGFEMDGIWLHLNWVGHIVNLYPCMEQLITQTKLQERLTVLEIQFHLFFYQYISPTSV